MPPAKKRRTTKPADAGSGSATSAGTGPKVVLRNLLEIATSKSRSEGVLQAFYEGKCWTELQPSPGSSTSSPSSSSPSPNKRTTKQLDCYWIILATSIMNRLLVLEDREGDSHDNSRRTENQGVVGYMTALADSVATILLSDKSKLEKSSHHSSSRSVLCRAVLTSSMASLHCIRNYDKPSTLEAAVATLDRLVHLKPSASKGDVSSSNLSTANLWTEDELEEECERVGKLLGFMELEEACVRALVEATSGVAHPEAANHFELEPSDRSVARSRRTSKKLVAVPTIPLSSSTAVGTTECVPPSAEILSQQTRNKDIDAAVIRSFQDLLKSNEFGSRIDGRVAIKRWASMALVWSHKGEGQLQLLMATHDLAGTPSTILSPRQKSNIIYKLICIASEAGTHCGVRPPLKGIDQYLRSISMKRQEEQGKGAGSTLKKVKTLHRADIRDWSTIVIYDFVQNHKECLELVESSTSETQTVVNGEVVETSNKDEEQAATTDIFLAPDFVSAVSCLCRSASSSVLNSSYSDQASWNKALTSITVAYCIELVADLSLPLDCKLAQFVASHITDCIRRVDPDSMDISDSSDVAPQGEGESSAMDSHRDFDNIYLLSRALPKACVSGDRDGRLHENVNINPVECTFAGVLPSKGSSYSANTFTDEQAISLAIRALQKGKGDPSPPAGKIWTFLIELIERIYDTRKQRVDTAVHEDENKVSTGKRKRPNKASATNRRGRRRKTVLGAATVEEEALVWHRITSPRAAVATEVLTSLRCLLMKTRGSAFTIRQFIRSFLKTNHLQNLVEMGEMIDQFIIKSGPSTLHSTNQDYTPFEKQLWSAHMSMCQVLGRGQLTYEANIGLDNSIWDSTNRHAVYRTIAKSSEGEVDLKWPLYLPSAHHAFLNANMSCIPIAHDKTIERNIVMGCINSIKLALENLDRCLQNILNDEELRFRDDEIPLSYNDARTFMLAINGLSPEEKQTRLESLIQITKTFLNSITRSETTAIEVFKKSEASGFLARVLVVCYSLMNSILAGIDLQIVFFATLGCSQLDLPPFLNQAEWYKKDRTYMGLFDYWGSPSLPEGIVDLKAARLPLVILADFRYVLEMAFTLGFDTAGKDHCYLLYTAWNGLGQLPRDDRLLAEAEQVPTLKTEKTDYSMKILDIRDDVCSIHQAMKEEGTISSTSDLSQVRLKAGLRGMVKQASTLVESLLRSYVPDDDDMKQAIPMPVFVLLKSLPTYISASIACHSKEGNDYFSAALSMSDSKASKWRKGYSAESDHPVESEGDLNIEADDYENNDRIDALSRLKECCDAFGAAPIHPDWLDVSCSLQDGVRPNEAVEIAEIAIKTLSNLATVAFGQYKQHQYRALKSELEDRGRDKNVNLAMSLLCWEPKETDPSHNPSDRDWRDDVAAITEMPQAALMALLDQSGRRNADRAKQFWCPFSCQRLPGLLHEGKKLIGGWESPSAALLRAGGEWELLLSEALAMSCINGSNVGMEFDAEKLPTKEALGPGFHDELANAQHWRTILLTATSNLMPAVALLRLGMAKVGRKPHPFSFRENNQDPFDVDPPFFSERLHGVANASESLTVTIFETLAMLSRLSVEGEENLSVTCYAVATHLMVNSDSFRDLECIHKLRCALSALKRILEVAESSPKRDGKYAIPHLAQCLVSIVEEVGQGGSAFRPSIGREIFRFQELHFFLGQPRLCLVDTVVGDMIDVFKILEAGKVRELQEDCLQTYHWSEQDRQRVAISVLVSILCCTSFQATDKTRYQIAGMLSHIGAAEATQSLVKSSCQVDLVVVPAAIEAFNQVDKKRLKSLLLKDLCGIRSDSPSPSFGRELGKLVALLLFTSTGTNHFEKAPYVHDTLISAFDFWKKIREADKEHVLCAMVIYGARFGSLVTIGTKLMEAEIDSNGEESPSCAKVLSFFFLWIWQLQMVLDKEGSNDSTRPQKVLEVSIRGSPQVKPKSKSDDFPRSCSFVQKSGFQGQHWYHCHTCNLVADKGCCSLCALVCHRDHDVAYSRYSSFFCDCAAEDGHPGEQNRVSCKCLAILPEKEVAAIVEKESSLRNPPLLSEPTDDEYGRKKSGYIGSCANVDIARVSFRDRASESVDDFINDVKKTRWLETLFLVLDKEFKTMKGVNADSRIEALLQEHLVVKENPPVFRFSHELLRRDLRNRKSEVMSIQHLVQTCYVPIRAANGFQAQFSSDSATHTSALGRLDRNNIQRSIMVSDSRGRMIIAEPSSLVFFSPVPAVNVRYVKRTCDRELQRHNMCILGTATLNFNIVGMCLCLENERHLIVWGTSEACFVILKPDFDGLEEMFNLDFELDHRDGEGDYVIKCEWLPKSQTHLAIGCSKFVRVYDISRHDSGKRATPVIGYDLGFESSLRDLCIVACDGCALGNDTSTGPSGNVRGETVSKMFLLLLNGRLHALVLKNSNGKIEFPGDSLFEPSECLTFSTAGIRTRLASSICPTGASTTTLGEGSKLAYLKQSRLLLYKCTSTAVVALMLDEDGIIGSTFELLPHTISADSLGNNEDGYSITGPYTHWTELGLVYRENATFFRVACLGRSTGGSSQTKILCIEFNDADVTVKELGWSPTNPLGLGICPGPSFEGLAAFSSPLLHRESLAPTGCKYFTGERAFLCALTSEGRLLIFGEDVVDVMSDPPEDSALENISPVKLISLPLTSSCSSRKPEFPLTLFERLKNISESNEVVIEGKELGIDSADLISRLSRDSSSSVVCTHREGCFLRIAITSLKGEKLSQLRSQDKKEPHGLGSNLAIAAIRVLVGSALDCMPSKIYVQGRPVEVTPRVKRWYNVPLTNEEIAMGLRMGFVSLWIGPTFDLVNSPVFDAVEVFAIDINSLEKVIPRTYFSTATATNVDASLLRSDGDEVASSNLVMIVRALTSLCRLMGPSVQISDTAKKLLQQIIQMTALYPEIQLRQSLQDFLACVEPDLISRWSFQDECLLVGCTRSLEDLKVFMKSNPSEDLKPMNTSWKSIRFILQDCLKISSTIARERPINYLQSMGNLLENSVSGSIAVEAAKLIVEGLKRSNSYEDLIGGPEGILALSLTETAIDLNSDASKSQNFAQFGNIRAFLDDTRASVVEKSCDAISSFFRDHGDDESINTSQDLFVQLEAARLVVYQCDSCSICPMKEVRYTDEGSSEDYGIDLCKECYNIGTAYARQKKYDPKSQVLIRSKTVGGETKLTCAHMKVMKPVSLGKMDIKQVEILSSKRQGSSEEAIDDDQELQKALKLSLGENVVDDVQHDNLDVGYRGYEEFLGALFAFVMEKLSSTLKKDHFGTNVGSIIGLALDLIGHSKCHSLKHDRATWFVKEVVNGISNVMSNLSPSGQKLDKEKTLSLMTCLRALSKLLAPQGDFESYSPDSKPAALNKPQSTSKDRTSSRFVCDVHGIPAARRRCAKGINKDRRFYVCGKERGQRCSFFVWADERVLNAGHAESKSQFHDIIKAFMWNRSSAGIPLHSRLRSLLETETLGEDSDSVEASFLPSKAAVRKGEESGLKSFYDVCSMEKDFVDGVFCSKEKLGDVVSGETLIAARMAEDCELTAYSKEPYDNGTSLLEASVGLLTLVADHKTDGISRWFSMLCEITMSTRKPEMKGLATKALKSLCGGKRAIYQSVRDHFAFAYQMKKLYHLSHDSLEAAMIVREKAHQSIDDFATSESKDWSKLCAGELIGAQDLIPEDAVVEVKGDAVGKVLADMSGFIKSRGHSWRRFCCLSALPHSLGRERSSSQQRRGIEWHLARAPPIVALLWIACASIGTNQVKVLRLIDSALTDWKDSKATHIKGSGDSSEEEGSHDQLEYSGLVIGHNIAATPELILLSGDMKLTISDVVALAINLGCNGRTTELRRVGCRVVSKLVETLSVDDKWSLFEYLVVAVEEIGALGKASMEFLALLQLVARCLSPRSRVGAVADFVLDGFLRQVDAIKYDRANGEWAQLETFNNDTVVRRTKIDLSGCYFCLKPNQPVMRETSRRAPERRDQSSTGRAALSVAVSGAGTDASSVRASVSRQKWHSDQVCPFSRGRLESGKDTATSSEFSTFYKLKYRVAISDIVLTVNDPRGRYVKTVNVFFSPRPVTVVTELKANHYATKWQPCATLSLARGATRTSARLAHPVVAANIKVEFAEFYERPGEKERAGDGSMSVHCPRCTRVVTNAHGVCGNCGEVAFQCRKCRHINYDRLDAFLCVECGYCPMGSFSFEANAGVATNAIAITNDRDYDKAVKMLGTAMSVQEELREVIVQKLRSMIARKQSNRDQMDLESFFDPAMQRAFLGLPPDDVWNGKDTPSHGNLRSRIDKQGSVVKLVARPDVSHETIGRSSSGGALDRSERTRSLLRLARQIRSDSGSSAERRRSTDAIIRHLGRGIGLDGMDDEDDLVDLLESGHILDDSAESATGGTSDTLVDVDLGRHRAKKQDEVSSRKTEIEECLKLVMQMKEAGKEGCELRRRISAWQCLESGCLVRQPKTWQVDSILSREASFAFSPSHCPVCAVPVAQQLLVLWLKLFLLDPAQIRIDRDFVELLVQDAFTVTGSNLPHQSKGLGECKKDVVVSIATKSEKGAEMVLEVLKKRFATSEDMIGAEILGKILEVERFPLSNEYSKFAIEILASQSMSSRYS